MARPSRVGHCYIGEHKGISINFNITYYGQAVALVRGASPDQYISYVWLHELLKPENWPPRGKLAGGF